MKKLSILLLIAGSLSASAPVQAKTLQTNSVLMPDAPMWLTQGHLERVVEKIQDKLEWDIRKIQAFWHPSTAEFEKMHGKGPLVMAYAKGDVIHLGPKVTQANFDALFGHELVHIIVRQKYGESVPKWLEEGLANYVSQHDPVDYAWLSTQTQRDVYTLAHPFNGAQSEVRYSYQAATATMEMLASKCGFHELLQLSMGGKMDRYFDTLCGISDLNASFKKWISVRAPSLKKVTAKPQGS